MEKEAIADLLEEKNQTLIYFLEHQDSEKWQEASIGCWTSGQHALHLLQCIKPLNNALSMPKIILRMKFGKTNNRVQSYDQVVKRYNDQFKEGEKQAFMESKNIKIPDLKDKTYIINRLQVENKKLQYKTRRISDLNLDTVVLPHPVMGRMPVRELIMSTVHHIDYHTKILQEKY